MFEIIESITASLLLFALSVYSVARERTVASISFSVCLLLLAIIEVTDRLLLNLFPDISIAGKGSLYLESLLPIVFLFLSFTYARQNSLKSVPLWGHFLMVIALVFPVIVSLTRLSDFVYSPDFQTERVLFLGNAGYWFYIGIMLFCTVALLNLEATLLASSGKDRWKIKFEVVGMSAILAVFIFYYSQGLLYKTINMNLLPVRSGVLIFGALMIGYSRLFRGAGIRIAVSRYVLYRSLTLLIVGTYLLFLGLVGEGMKYFGPSFSNHLALFLAFAAGIAMCVVLLSETLRRKTKVFLNKHFFAHKYDYREEWLKFTGQLSLCKTVADAEDTILKTFTETFDLRGASLFTLNKGNTTYKQAANHSMKETRNEFPISPGLAGYFQVRHRVLDPQAAEYTLTEQDRALVQQTGADLIVPLLSNGNIEGFVCLGSRFSGDKLIYEDYDLMKTFARQAVLSIVNFRLSEELAETREMAAVAKVSSFIIHDLKNLAYTLSLLLENAGEYIENPEFQKDMMGAIRNAVNQMQELIQRLKHVPEKKVLHVEAADISAIAQEIFGNVRNSRKDLDMVCQGEPVVCMVDEEEIKKVLTNLILNASDAVKQEGSITIETGMRDGNGYIMVRDTGCGMTEEFIKHHLFKPFRTTKTKGLGIGLYQCKQIVEAHGGRIEALSETGKGSEFVVYVPVKE